MAQNTYLIFKEEHYSRIFKYIMLALLLYFLPLLGLIGLSYYHGETQAEDDTVSEGIVKEGKRNPSSTLLFMRWMIDTLMSDSAGFPLVYSIVLHIQLLALLGALLVISEDLQSNMEKLSQIRQAAKQDQYNALELNTVLPMEFIHPREPPRATLLQTEIMN